MYPWKLFLLIKNLYFSRIFWVLTPRHYLFNLMHAASRLFVNLFIHVCICLFSYEVRNSDRWCQKNFDLLLEPSWGIFLTETKLSWNVEVKVILTDTQILNVTLSIPKAFPFEHEGLDKENYNLLLLYTSMVSMEEQGVTLNMNIKKLHKDCLYIFIKMTNFKSFSYFHLFLILEKNSANFYSSF